MDNKNLSIFVFAHKDFDLYPKNDVYKTVVLNESECKNTKLERIVCQKDKDEKLKLEHSYSEGARLHYIWKNIELPKYVGTAHYRRYFDFYENIPNLDEVFEKYDGILPNFNLGWPSVYENYRNSHNIKDYIHVIDIIKNHFPEFLESAEYVSNHGLFYPCNMFVLKRETFIKYCEFVFGVLDIFDKEMGFNTDLDVYNHVVNNMEEYCKYGAEPNGFTFYQSRIQAFLMERLSTIFFYKEIKNPLLMDILITDVRYDFERDWFKEMK